MPKKQKQKNKKSATKKRRGGGSNSGFFAYPQSKAGSSPNPSLAYTGHNSSLKGGFNARTYPATTSPSGGNNLFPNPLHQTGGHSYPNGLVGAPYNSQNNLPGANSIGGDANYYKYNINPTLQTRSLISAGANPPFLRGGSSKKRKLKRGKRLNGGTCPLMRQSGGATSSNTITQELVNVGRNIPFTLKSAYNGFFGYSPPINPSPLVGQLVRPVQRP